MIKLLLLLVPFCALAQTTNVEDLLTADTWNISYNISPEGERMDEESQEKIRSSWVRFLKNGTYETPAGVSGKTIGKWTYNAETNAIHFNENGSKYRAIIDEISDISLVLNYVDNGGFKLGLIHYVYIPKAKSKEETTQLLTSGKWNVILKRYEGMEDKVPSENVENTWYEFYPEGTYQKSEVIDEETVTNEGTWFLDENFLLNLDAGENTIYSVIGDKSNLILTTTSGGYNTIEMRKAKEISGDVPE